MKSYSMRYIGRVTKIAAVGIFFILGTHFFLLQPSEVNGRSMEPTLVDENIIFIEKVSLLFRAPERGDIVSVIREGTNRKLVKRVIGLPGERVLLKDGYVTIVTADEELIPLGEEYVNDQGNTYPAENESRLYDVVPEHSVFIMGDNRLHSVDSRVYGSVHRNEIVGLIRLRN